MTSRTPAVGYKPPPSLDSSAVERPASSQTSKAAKKAAKRALASATDSAPSILATQTPDPNAKKAQAVVNRLLGGEDIPSEEQANNMAVASLQCSSAPVVRLSRPSELDGMDEKDKVFLQQLFSTYKLSTCIDTLELITAHLVQLCKKASVFIPSDVVELFLLALPEVMLRCNGAHILAIHSQDGVEAGLIAYHDLCSGIERMETFCPGPDKLKDTRSRLLIKQYGKPEAVFEELLQTANLLKALFSSPGLCTDNLTAYEQDGALCLNVASIKEVDQCLRDMGKYAEMMFRMSRDLHCTWLDSVITELQEIGKAPEKLSLEQKRARVFNLVRSMIRDAHQFDALPSGVNAQEGGPISWKKIGVTWIDNIARILESQVLVQLDPDYVSLESFYVRFVYSFSALPCTVDTTELPSKQEKNLSDKSEQFLIQIGSATHTARTVVWLSCGFNRLNSEFEGALQRTSLSSAPTPSQQSISSKKLSRLALLCLMHHDIQCLLGLREPGNPFPDEYIEDLLLLEDQEAAHVEALEEPIAPIEGPASVQSALPPETVSVSAAPQQMPKEGKAVSVRGPSSAKKGTPASLADLKQTTPKSELKISSREEVFSVLKLALKEMFVRKKRKREELLRDLGYEPAQLGKGSHTLWRRPGEDSRLATITIPNDDEISVGVHNQHINTIAQAIAKQVAASHLKRLGFVSAREGSYDVWMRQAEDGRLLTLITDYQAAEDISQAQSSADPASQPSKSEHPSKKK